MAIQYLHLKAVLSPDELREAKQAAYAYTAAVIAGDPLPEGFAAEPGTVLGNGFAFHPALAQLAVHPTALPIIRELCGGKPQLRRGSLLWDHPTLSGSDGVPLHSGREDYPGNYGGCEESCSVLACLPACQLPASGLAACPSVRWS